METGKMICPHCKVEMNHHSDKLVYGDASITSQGDPAFDGLTLQEFHTCPDCGGGASRQA